MRELYPIREILIHKRNMLYFLCYSFKHKGFLHKRTVIYERMHFFILSFKKKTENCILWSALKVKIVNNIVMKFPVFMPHFFKRIMFAFVHLYNSLFCSCMVNFHLLMKHKFYSPTFSRWFIYWSCIYRTCSSTECL